jgi:beta-N-acetylhexosaminidase
MIQGQSGRLGTPAYFLFAIIYLLIFLQAGASCRGPETLSSDTEAHVENAEIAALDLLLSKGISDVDVLMSSMSLRQKIGQMFVVAARGGFYRHDDRSWKHMSDAVVRHEVGGIMFFSGSIYDQAIVTNRLQKMSRIPLWVSQDMEFGAAMRIPQATYFTPAMGIAATGNPEYAYQKGYITAKEASAFGIHQIYAPVLDVNNNPLNPVINVRSYSENPDTVARYGIAFMEGVRDAGVMPTAKHFPGHGDTDVDSHLDLPVLPFDYYRLSSLELVPFREAILAGLPSVMTAHISLPEIAQNSGHPGTLDPYITKSLLRDTLAFEGLIVTDGMGMRGIRNFFESGEAAVLAVKAGIDQILLPVNLLEAMDAVYLAVLSGEIPEERINDSVRRILNEKIGAGLFREVPVVDIYQLPSLVHTREHRLVADHIARKSIALLKNVDQVLPLEPERYEKVTVVSISDGIRNPDDQISPEVSRFFGSARSVQMYPGQCKSDSLDAVEAIMSADLVIAVSHIAIRTAEDINLDDTLGPVMDQLLLTGSPVVGITLGTPYAVLNMSRADAHVLGWSPNPRQQAAVTNALFGKAPVTGRLQVSIPPLYSAGDGIILYPEP